MNAVLDIRGLTTSFVTGRSKITAVHDVTFDVQPGRVLGLVGESGSGKSVIARSVMRLLSARGRIDKGSVHLNGRDMLALSEDEMQTVRGSDIAMVFQDPQSTLNPVIRVGDQVIEALEVHGIERQHAQGQALELLASVGIPEPKAAMERYPHQFSGGMRQRVVIAIALANKPSLLIADEPTTALDVTIQAQILRLLADLRHELGVAIVMITHDMGVVAELCDDLVVMYGGRVVERGSVDAVFRAPRHPYTAALLNAVPRLDGNGGALKAIPGNPPLAGSLPPGCAFHERCAFVTDACRTAVPATVDLGAGRSAACIHASNLSRDLAPTAAAHAAAAQDRTTPSEPILQVVDLRTDVNADAQRFYRPHQPINAVDGVSLEVRAGETLGLVGESGCGKSTLSRTIVGIQAAASGRIVVDGRDVSAMTRDDLGHISRTIQYVFQDPSASLNPRRTIGQSLAEALEISGILGDAAHSRSGELVDQVGLSRTHLIRYPYELSGGQKQRVGIARALATSPKMLICDEPVSALDVSIQAQIINLLEELRDELNLGFLFIAHDLSVVRHISDHLAVMYLGRFVETGPAAQIYDHPTHPYTASLLSAIPVAEVNRDMRDRPVLAGDMPSLVNPPSGCRFRTRCPIGPAYRSDRTRCVKHAPELGETRPGQYATCHYWRETASASEM